MATTIVEIEFVGLRSFTPVTPETEYKATVAYETNFVETDPAVPVVDDLGVYSVVFRQKLTLTVGASFHTSGARPFTVSFVSADDKHKVGSAMISASRSWCPISVSPGTQALMVYNVVRDDSAATAAAGTPPDPRSNSQRYNAYPLDPAATSPHRPAASGTNGTSPASKWAGSLVITMRGAQHVALSMPRASLFASVHFSTKEMRTLVHQASLKPTGFAVTWNEDMTFDIQPHNRCETVTVKLWYNTPGGSETSNYCIGYASFTVPNTHTGNSSRGDEQIGLSQSPASIVDLSWRLGYHRPLQEGSSGRPMSAYSRGHNRPAMAQGYDSDDDDMISGEVVPEDDLTLDSIGVDLTPDAREENRPGSAAKLRQTVDQSGGQARAATAGANERPVAAQAWAEGEQPSAGQPRGETPQFYPQSESVPQTQYVTVIAFDDAMRSFEDRIQSMMTDLTSTLLHKISSLETRMLKTEEQVKLLSLKTSNTQAVEDNNNASSGSFTHSSNNASPPAAGASSNGRPLPSTPPASSGLTFSVDKNPHRPNSAAASYGGTASSLDHALGGRGGSASSVGGFPSVGSQSARSAKTTSTPTARPATAGPYGQYSHSTPKSGDRGALGRGSYPSLSDDRPGSAMSTSIPLDVSNSYITDVQLHDKFREYDSDNTGYITVAQLQQFYRESTIDPSDDDDHAMRRFIQRYVKPKSGDLVNFDVFAQVALKLAQR